MASSQVLSLTHNNFLLPLNHSQYYLSRILTKEQVLEALSQAEEFTKESYGQEVACTELYEKVMRIVKEEGCSGRGRLKERLIKEGVRSLPFKAREEVWPRLVGDYLYITD